VKIETGMIDNYAKGLECVFGKPRLPCGGSRIRMSV
jgi:hypothetical protein